MEEPSSHVLVARCVLVTVKPDIWQEAVCMVVCWRAGREAAKPRPPLSRGQQRDIKNLDNLLKGWSSWRDLLARQADALQHEADVLDIGGHQPSSCILWSLLGSWKGKFLSSPP